MNRRKWQWNKKLDVVSAAPNFHRVLLENDKVRVVEVIIKPLTKEPVHTHEWPSVMVVRSSAKIRYFNKDNKSTQYPKRNISPEQPFIEYLEPEEPHAVENIDTEVYQALRIEIKN